jgi:hypothetical protein
VAVYHEIQSYPADIRVDLADGVGTGGRRWGSCCRTQSQVCAVLAALLTALKRNFRKELISLKFEIF